MGMSDENAKALLDLMPDLAGGLIRYAEHGLETGGFLRACLEFDLEAAYARADSTNRGRVPAIFDWIGKNMPTNSFGSRQAVETWISVHKHERHAKTSTFQNLNTYAKRHNRAITDGRMLHQDPPTDELGGMLDLKAEQRREWESGLL